MTFAVKYEHVSAFEGVPDGSSEGTPTFEVGIKDVLVVTKGCTKGVLDVIKGTPLSLKFGFLSVICILYSAEQTKLLTSSN